MGRGLVGIVVGMLIALAVIGGIDGDGTATQLAAERTERTTIEQNGRTERVAIVEENRTERTYIAANQLMWLATERESTFRLIVLLLIVMVASTAAVIVVVQISRQRPKTQVDPPFVLRQVAQWPGHRLEYDAREGWIVVLPNGLEFYTIDDAQRLLEGGNR